MNETFDDRPSKSQLKRDAQDLRRLGDRMVAMKAEELASLPLPERVREAVMEARAMRSHGARKRQSMFIGKLLRDTDVARRDEAARGLVASHHRVEAWRDRLLEDGDSALATLLDQRPGTDAQPLRQLLRTALREQADGRPPAAARKLFRALHALDRETPLPPAEP